jgi:hypothetical protein
MQDIQVLTQDPKLSATNYHIELFCMPLNWAAWSAVPPHCWFCSF